MHKEKPMPCAVQGESSTVELSEQSKKKTTSRIIIVMLFPRLSMRKNVIEQKGVLAGKKKRNRSSNAIALIADDMLIGKQEECHRHGRRQRRQHQSHLS